MKHIEYSKKEIIDEIIRVQYGYNFGSFGIDMIPKEFIDWTKTLLKKLDNKSLAQEARKCGINVKAKEII